MRAGEQSICGILEQRHALHCWYSGKCDGGTSISGPRKKKRFVVRYHAARHGNATLLGKGLRIMEV